MDSSIAPQPSAEQRPVEATTFGFYDPVTLGVSFEGIQSLATDVQEDENRIFQRLMEAENSHRSPEERNASVGPFREQLETGTLRLHVTQSELASFTAMKEAHQRQFAFYYRVRAHEKNHWYTHISSVVPLARFFSYQDISSFLWSALGEMGSEKCYLPLLVWSQRQDCPRALSDRISLYHINHLVNRAVDGDSVPQGDWHILSAYFPELARDTRFWTSPAYQVGFRALVEGAGKAAEWLYMLREDLTSETEAWTDIRRAPRIYRLGLERLLQTIPGRTLLEYLQLLSVLVDYAINPPVSRERWPFIWGGTPAADTLPGFRFQRLLELLPKYPALDMNSKEAIAEFLTSASKRAYGWASTAESAASLSTVVASAKAIFPDKALFPEEKLWNPLETIRLALAVKEVDPLAYVAPVNAHLINASRTYPQVTITKPGYKAGDDKSTITYFLSWYQTALLNSLVYDEQGICPCAYNEWFRHLISMANACELSSGGVTDRRLAKCRLSSAYLGDPADRFVYIRGGFQSPGS